MRAFEERVIARHTAAGHWDPEPLAARIAVNATRRTDATAFVEGDDRLTWGDYDAQSTRLGAKLAACGLAPDEHVAVLMPDGPAVHVAYVAAEKAGLIVAGIGPRSRANEIAHVLEVTGCTTLLTGPLHRGAPASELVAELRARGRAIRRHLVLSGGYELTLDGERAGEAPAALLAGRALGPDDLFLVNSTSGTTGLPKCVMQTHNRWKYFHQVAADAGELTGDDVFASLIPAPFGFGLWTAHFTPTLLGAPTVLLRDFDPEAALAAIERERVTVLCCVSTQYILMLNSPALERYDLSSLRVMFTGGERVPYNRSVEFEQRTGCLVLQFYGSNESGAVSRTTTRDPAFRRLRTAGRVIDAMNARVIDLETGEELLGTGRKGLCLAAGPAATPGYYRDPAANEKLWREDGHMRTSDIVTVDDEGYLTVVGRDSDVIIRGGQNISAAAVEDVVGTHPAVAVVSVVATPDDVFGERVCACIALHAGTTLELPELTAFLDQAGVSKYMWPERLVLLGELPRATGGKVDKAELRRMVRETPVA
jgi:acyl-CoA synthetase